MRTAPPTTAFAPNAAVQAIAILHGRIRRSAMASIRPGTAGVPSLLDVARLQVARLLMARDSSLTLSAAIQLGNTLADGCNRSRHAPPLRVVEVG
jgi:hypothetical protein